MLKPHATVVSERELLRLLRSGHDLAHLRESLTSSRYWKYSLVPSNAALNSNPDDLHYVEHLERMRNFLRDARGAVLDIGCGSAEIGVTLFPEDCKYVGIDPFVSSPASGQYIGAAEELPFLDSCFDVVLFNTSLDHILDYCTALREARRVLKPSGTLYIATLVWHANFSLLTDEIHFHHFKRFEIDGATAFCGFAPVASSTSKWKSDAHRSVLYAKYRAAD